MRKLQARQELFAREYVIDLNGSRAALAAGYSEKTAGVQACNLLKNHKVKRLVEQLLAKRHSKLDVTGERIIEELAKLAFFDARSIWNEDGSLKPIREWDDAAASALAGIEHEKLFEHFGKGQAAHVGTTTKVKLLARTEALRMLGQYRKLFTEKIEVAGDTDMMAALAAGRQRIRKSDGDTQPKS